MTSSIDLVWLSEAVPVPFWRSGTTLAVAANPGSVATAVDCLLRKSLPAAVMFWDPNFGCPNESLLRELLAGPNDCSHAGLLLGTAGLPRILPFVAPGWMLACDPLPTVEATSWKVSLRACLVRTTVIQNLGGLRSEFCSLECAALELGHRWIRRGAFIRHVPRMLEPTGQGANGRVDPMRFAHKIIAEPHVIPFDDELRLVYYRFGRKWAAWAAFRALTTRYAQFPIVLRAWSRISQQPRPNEPRALRSTPETTTFASQISGRISTRDPGLGGSSTPQSPFQLRAGSAFLNGLSPKITVLIPTVDRYPYLRVLLGQLRNQTLKPFEIIIIDQTAPDRRERKLDEEFHDLPLNIIVQDWPGQCSSRNAGLQLAQGDYVLFLDDDDEIPCDLLEAHYKALVEFNADVSCGVAYESGAGDLPGDFKLIRASDVFPTNNAMVVREILRQSGLFDLAYERGQRADGDLGMRLYLSGARMVLNPSISVFHHHAPSGGLRKHKARKTTYAMSRQQILSRALSSTSDIYLVGRYFTPENTREMLWQSVLGTFSVRGSALRRFAKFTVSTLLLPSSLMELRSRVRKARRMFSQYPQIAGLQENSSQTALS